MLFLYRQRGIDKRACSSPGTLCKRSGTGLAVSPDSVSSVTTLTIAEVDIQASDLIFVFTHPHLSVFVSLSLFSMSLRHL